MKQNFPAFSPKGFRQSCHKCILCVQRNTLRNMIFLEEFSFSDQLRTFIFRTMFSGFRQKFIARVFENAFYVSEENFWEKKFKEFFRFSNFFLHFSTYSFSPFSTLSWKFSAFGPKSFGRVCIRALYVTRQYLWGKFSSTKKKQFFHLFRTSWRNFSAFRLKLSEPDNKNCILSVQRSLCIFISAKNIIFTLCEIDGKVSRFLTFVLAELSKLPSTSPEEQFKKNFFPEKKQFYGVWGQ